MIPLCTIHQLDQLNLKRSCQSFNQFNQGSDKKRGNNKVRNMKKVSAVLTGRQLRVRWLLLRAPMVVVPLLTIIFWAMGGGPGDAGKHRVSSGFDMRLPGAQLARMGRLDKLGYYQQAEKDSMEARQRRSLEANYAKMLGLPAAADSGRGVVRSVDPTVKAVQVKLEALNQIIKNSAISEGSRGVPASRLVRPAGVLASSSGKPNPSMDRLEKLMGVLRKTEAGQGHDPEIEQLNGVLDKLVAVQRPRKDSSRESGGQVARRATLTVRALRDEDDTAIGDRVVGADTSVIAALVPEEQVLVSGGELRMELARDVEVGGQRIPRGTPVYGSVVLSGERLRVAVTAICWQERVYPVNLVVDDQDGLSGIHIPGAPASDAVRESADQDVGGLGPTILSTTLAGQAAGAGMSLARAMVSKKVRLVRVTIPAGYRVILHVQNAGI
jgi:hypothetical protein